MRELSRYFFLAGAAPYIVLGLAHALATPRSPAQRKGLSPAEPGLAEAMARSSLLLTRRTDVWRAWVGFNLSHSLGAVVFGGAVLLTGRSQAGFDRDALLAVPLALLVSLGYMRLGLLYWFRTPIIGIAVSVVLFLLAGLTLMVSMPWVWACGA
jgi:hypothetical protein